ncbi:MAG: HAMP domain-containing sensor histidine kinase [Pseudomonadota bacterium]
MRLVGGISARLLILTVVVVMILEVVIFVPSVARFREEFLKERLVRAEIAALTVMAAPSGDPGPEIRRQLLDSANALNVAVLKDGVRILALPGALPSPPMASFDLRNSDAFGLMRDAINCLVFTRGEDVQRVAGSTQAGFYDTVEITFRAEELRQEMMAYGMRVLQLSLIISVFTAVVVFVVVRGFVVKPLLDVIQGVQSFHENPEDPARVLRPKGRLGEVAAAERAIAAMQQDVLSALRERARLAALGEAVAKIAHDLRNMLAAGQLMTERLEMSDDPLVARVLPKIVGSLDRAVTLCQSTLAYGRAEERRPEPRLVDFERLLEDIVEGLGLPLGPGSPTNPGGTNPPTLPPAIRRRAEAGGATDGKALQVASLPAPQRRVLSAGPVPIIAEIAPGTLVLADPDQLYRILANLVRNAVEAIRTRGRGGEIRICTGASGGETRIEVRDTGPGLPAKALENLFQPFRGSARRGGSGLGLAIASELAQAHGGRLELIATSTSGTSFMLRLPDHPRS